MLLIGLGHQSKLLILLMNVSLRTMFPHQRRNKRDIESNIIRGMARDTVQCLPAVIAHESVKVIRP